MVYLHNRSILKNTACTARRYELTNVGIWHAQIGHSPERLILGSLPSEAQLERWVSDSPEIIRPGLHKVGNQVKLGAKKLDLLCIEEPSTWVVVEFKNATLARDVIAQALDYAARFSELTIAELKNLVLAEKNNYSADTLKLIQSAMEEEESGDSRNIRIVVAGTNISEELHRIIRFTSSYEMPISTCALKSYTSPTGMGHLLVREDYEDVVEMAQTKEGSRTLDIRMNFVLDSADKHGNQELMKLAVDALRENPYIALVPYKWGIMVAPRSNRSRYLAYIGSRSKGLRLDYGVDELTEFFPTVNTEPLQAFESKIVTRDLDVVTSWTKSLDEVISAAGADLDDTASTWNGKDWYVAFGDSSSSRNWDDAVRLGFVSAGGGKWYSQTLQNLPIGASIFVYIPQTGYVGHGVTKSLAVVFEESKFSDRSDLLGRYTHDNGEPEYVVEVDWIKAISKDEAIWQKGLFANQNSACHLSHAKTLEILRTAFHG
jgi:hypothetical protein